MQKNGCGKTDAEKKFEDGCYSLFKSKFIDNIAIIGGRYTLIITRLSRTLGFFLMRVPTAVALGVAGIELAIVLFACCLGKRCRSSDHTLQ